MAQPEASSRGRMYYFGPPLVGALVLFAIVGFRLLVKLPSIVRNPALLTQSLAVLAIATGAGCLGGVAYVVLGRPARRVRVVGPYLAGVITIAAYMGALLCAFQFHSADPPVKNRSDLILFAVISVLFGLFAGHSWFGKNRMRSHSADPPAV
jgi:hypothetical protein